MIMGRVKRETRHRSEVIYFEGKVYTGIWAGRVVEASKVATGAGGEWLRMNFNVDSLESG